MKHGSPSFKLVERDGKFRLLLSYMGLSIPVSIFVKRDWALAGAHSAFDGYYRDLCHAAEKGGFLILLFTEFRRVKG